MSQMIRAGVAITLLGASACSDGPGPEELNLPEMPEGIHALVGIDPRSSYADLGPFRDIVGEATHVALGESTHTSGGFYRAKARLIRYMVEALGFRVVLWETPWQEALPATAYVRSCSGSAEGAVGALFPVWNDVNVRDLLIWLCEWNRAHPSDPVHFYGMDIQEPWKSAPATKAFVQLAAPSEMARTQPLDSCLGATYEDWTFFASQEWQDIRNGIRNQPKHDECLAGITALESWIDANAAALQGSSSARAVEEARLHLVSLRAMETALFNPDPVAYEARDRGMAELVRRLPALYAPGKKTVVWAWNWHIARGYEDITGWDEDPDELLPRQTARSMGSFLDEALGDDYAPIALIGYQVQCRSCVGPPPLQVNPQSVERRLHDLDWPTLLVDLRQPVALFPPGETYRVSQEWGDPYAQFEALLFLEHSAPMQPVPLPGASMRR